MAISTSAAGLPTFFLSLMLLLLFAQLFGYIFHRLRMPKVVGEIFGGLLLGPTVLGFFFPELYGSIFEMTQDRLGIVYWLGLILLMFCSGFELQTKFNARDKKTVIAITATSTIIPFVAGWLLFAFINPTQLMGTANNLLSLQLVVAIAIAVTSIPVVSKIFFDLNIIKTRFSKIVLSTATFHDIILWVFLAIATSLATSSQISATSLSLHVLIILALFGIGLLITPKIIRLFNRFSIYPIPKNYEVGFILMILLLFIVLAAYLSINVVFGAFLAGIVVGFVKNKKFKEARLYIKEVSFALFIPIYFAIVGINLDLIHHFDLPFFLGFLALALAVQGATVFATAKLLGYTMLSSVNLAMAMNARGGPGIVLATVAFDVGIINESFFVTLILLAVISSLIAGVWLRYVTNRKLPLLESKNSY